MRICLLGKSLTNLVLANVLANKKLEVDIYYTSKLDLQKSDSPITLAISNENHATRSKNGSKRSENGPKWCENAWQCCENVPKLYGRMQNARETCEIFSITSWAVYGATYMGPYI